MLEFAGQLPVIVWTLWAAVVGACVGSLLNVCIARLPHEKSLLWPSSRCFTCLQKIRWLDNIPLISYWLLRGKCRNCGARFSIRYFLVELFTAVIFAGIFWLEVVQNVRSSDFIRDNAWAIRNGNIPLGAWLVILRRWVLVSFLIVISGCDLQSREIPLSITITGTAVGLLFSACLPWPWPESLDRVPPNAPNWWLMQPGTLPTGAQLWPFWGPAPPWMEFGSFVSGLMTGIVGLLAGTWLVRAVRFFASRGLGREALGMGDADLMMMVGAFLGWQAVVSAFFVGAMAALVIAVFQVLVFRDDSLPFGPGLAIGTVVTFLAWPHIGLAVQPLLFNSTLLALVFGVGGVLLFALCYAMSFIRGRPTPEEPAK